MNNTPERNPESSYPSERDSLSKSYSPFQLLFLLRFARLLNERIIWEPKVDSNDWRMKLLNKAIYSTFCDCVEQGVSEVARNIFESNKNRRF